MGAIQVREGRAYAPSTGGFVPAPPVPEQARHVARVRLNEACSLAPPAMVRDRRKTKNFQPRPRHNGQGAGLLIIRTPLCAGPSSIWPQHAEETGKSVAAT